MNLTYITSKDNPLVKQYIKLRDFKKHRAEEKKFVLEGARIISDAAEEGIKIDFGFITDLALEKYPEAAEQLYNACKGRIYGVSPEIASRLSDTKGGQGIFCCAFALDKILTADTINNGGKYLVLNNLQDPGNVGTIMRSCDAVGADGVFLCGCCDIYNPKTVRSTMGSMFRLKWSDGESYENVISALKKRGVYTYASVIDKDASSVRELEFKDSCAVVIGNEGSGLTKEEALLCDERITIRMRGNINSLNAAMAAGIILWEMTK